MRFERARFKQGIGGVRTYAWVAATNRLAPASCLAYPVPAYKCAVLHEGCHERKSWHSSSIILRYGCRERKCTPPVLVCVCARFRLTYLFWRQPFGVNFRYDSKTISM